MQYNHVTGVLTFKATTSSTFDTVQTRQACELKQILELHSRALNVVP